MGGVHRTVPLFIVCKRPGCEQIRQVRRPYLQRRGGYCSSRCANLATHNLTRAAAAKGGRVSASHKRTALVARLDGLSKLAAFRLGYDRGLQAKWRALRRQVERVTHG
jgi:hypothetical protein